MRRPRRNISCMEMKNSSLYRIFALSLIFVTANKLYAKADEICEIGQYIFIIQLLKYIRHSADIIMHCKYELTCNLDGIHYACI